MVSSDNDESAEGVVRFDDSAVLRNSLQSQKSVRTPNPTLAQRATSNNVYCRSTARSGKRIRKEVKYGK